MVYPNTFLMYLSIYTSASIADNNKVQTGLCVHFSSLFFDFFFDFDESSPSRFCFFALPSSFLSSDSFLSSSSSSSSAFLAFFSFLAASSASARLASLTFFSSELFHKAAMCFINSVCFRSGYCNFTLSCTDFMKMLYADGARGGRFFFSFFFLPSSSALGSGSGKGIFPSLRILITFTKSSRQVTSSSYISFFENDGSSTVASSATGTTIVSSAIFVDC
mmetsp:Transcript_49642/g.94863  ORF Transcript_49642/g.94863 Transcript_49642/m.94863 type:complete len:220 (+) Transcript_49642:399-1058(+)